LQGVPPRVPKSSPEEFRQQYYPADKPEVEGQVLDIMVACGPYTLDANLQFVFLSFGCVDLG
jgi:hypothetical protein